MRYYLTIILHSDATFGRGEGVAGLVDVEIEHDRAGCPFLGGRALKGLLVEAWVDIAAALERAGHAGDTHAAKALAAYQAAAERLFGTIGATRGVGPDGVASGPVGHLHVDAATLPPSLRARLHRDVADEKITSTQVLSALTAIRRQTAVSAETGAPEIGSLRAMRVLLRTTSLIAALDLEGETGEDDLPLLAACALGVRRAGVVRNRGRGRLSLLLHVDFPPSYADATFTRKQFAAFEVRLRGGA